MAKYKQLSYGSQGSEVTDLQKLLNQNGYKLTVDGIFGSQTQNAVRDYQKKNNLTVDGIAGDQTFGALNKVQAPATSAQTTTKAPATTPEKTTPTFKFDAYQESDAVKQAQAMLNQQLAQKPGAYQSAWQTQLDDTIKKILNREKFSYDLNGDALYQQYKGQYMAQGQQAMMDTMGQAQAMTGGYGNSYAQTAGQQTYQGYLQQLNDKVPELYQLALDKYQMEGQDLLNQYSMLGAQEEQDYGRYRDQVSDYNAELNRLQSQYNAERDYDYSKYTDNRDFSYGQFTDDRNYQYQQDRDAIADQQWQDSFQYQKDRDAVADQQWQKEFDEAQRQFNKQYSLSASKYTNPSPANPDTPSDTPSDAPGYDNGSVSEQAIKQMQISLGIEADGKWGAASKAAAGGLSADEAYKKWNKGQLSGASTVNEGNVKKFMAKIHPESQHDAVARSQYGSYRQYVAYQIEHSGLSDIEKAYLISYYGIQESDTDYKKLLRGSGHEFR